MPRLLVKFLIILSPLVLFASITEMKIKLNAHSVNRKVN